MIKNLPTMQETWVLSLGWKDPLEKGMTTYSRILAWRILMDRGAWQATVHGVTESDTTAQISAALKLFYKGIGTYCDACVTYSASCITLESYLYLEA